MKNFGNDVMDPYCMQQLRNELDNIRMKELLKNEEKDLIQLIDTITLTADPCAICQWWKAMNKKCMVTCSGVKDLCTLKYEFFKEWPDEMISHADTTYILCTEHCVCIKGMHVCTHVMLILVIVSTLGSFIYKIHSLYHSFLYVVDDITQIHCWVDYVGCANNYHTSQTLGYTM